ncbi:VOC family protein [Cypionkella sp.]|uniref:VOC family protein n=1 Tax=Cypionkella sp. TaxID=2811411 RepID=UPI002FDED20C
MLRFDHLAVSALDLAEGVAWVEEALGTKLAGGGQHPHMATHNRLLGLGDLYLEVIAADPSAAKPAWPRWFDLDTFTGRPRLTNWIAGCDDLTAALRASPDGTGAPVALQRGDYRWQMAVPKDGKLPFGGGFPALIQWQGTLHPARALPDSGLRLRRLDIAHPDADALRGLLAPLIQDDRFAIVQGRCAMRASFDTPSGLRVLE